MLHRAIEPWVMGCSKEFDSLASVKQKDLGTDFWRELNLSLVLTEERLILMEYSSALTENSFIFTKDWEGWLGGVGGSLKKPIWARKRISLLVREGIPCLVEREITLRVEWSLVFSKNEFGYIPAFWNLKSQLNLIKYIGIFGEQWNKNLSSQRF